MKGELWVLCLRFQGLLHYRKIFPIFYDLPKQGKICKFVMHFILASFFFLKMERSQNFFVIWHQNKDTNYFITKSVKFLCTIKSTGGTVQRSLSPKHAVLHFLSSTFHKSKIIHKNTSFICTINNAAFTNYVDVPFYRIRAFSSEMTTFNLISQNRPKMKTLKKRAFVFIHTQKKICSFQCQVKLTASQCCLYQYSH